MEKVAKATRLGIVFERCIGVITRFSVLFTEMG